MRALLLLLLLLLLIATVALSQAEPHSQLWAIELVQPSDALPAALASGCRLVRRLHLLSSYAIVHCSRRYGPGRIRRSVGRWAERQIVKRRVKRATGATAAAAAASFNDPLFAEQWYLAGGAAGGHDLDVAAAWSMGYTGRGAVVSILDDGVEYDHPDLRDNYDPAASHDVNGHDSDPAPRPTASNENRHGTRCAGEVAAKANNAICNVGIAFNARIGGIRMLDGPITDSVEAESLSFNQHHIDIYSSSWGPDDDGRTVDGPGRLAKEAFLKGVTKGRGGLGNIFVWASGNGGRFADSCACDGYTNSIYTLSVSSVTQGNTRPWYLEECASTLAATYSSGGHGDAQIATTDLHGQCTTTHTGTSASAPIAAGMVALALEANRNLTWRDVQHVTVMAADSSFLVDAEWLTNAAGLRHSRRYGFGVMSAARMVALASLWARPVPPLARCQLPAVTVQQRLPARGPLTVAIDVRNDSCVGGGGGGSSMVGVLESVQLHLDISFSNRGQLQVALISPSGTRSLLLSRRPHDGFSGDCGFQRWPLMSVQFWRERRVAGVWRVEVENGGSPSNRGVIKSATLVLLGTVGEPLLLRRPSEPVPPWLAPYRSVMNAAAPCHRLCAQADNCSGPLASDCARCRYYRRRQLDSSSSSNNATTATCVESCAASAGEYGDPDSGWCRHCHPACLSCLGPGRANCTACRDYALTVESSSSSSGSSAAVVSCLPAGSSCPQTGYWTDDAARPRWCRPCHPSCRACVGGSGPQNCLSCSRQDACLLPRNNGSVGRCLVCSYHGNSSSCASQVADYRTTACCDATNPPTVCPPQPSPEPTSPVSFYPAASSPSAATAMYAFVGVVSAIVLVCLVGYCYCCAAGEDGEVLEDAAELVCCSCRWRCCCWRLRRCFRRRWRQEGDAMAAVSAEATAAAAAATATGVKCSYQPVALTSPSASPTHRCCSHQHLESSSSSSSTSSASGAMVRVSAAASAALKADKMRRPPVTAFKA